MRLYFYIIPALEVVSQIKIKDKNLAGYNISTI